MHAEKTRAWQLYEEGRTYNNSQVPNQYRVVKANIDFFTGNQWVNLPDNNAMRRLPKPTFNIIKRIVSLFVASLTSSGASIGFSPLTDVGNAGEGSDAEAARIATMEVSNLLEKFKMEYRIREALFDGAQTGDYCAHFRWDANALPYGGMLGPERGEIQMELIDGINVMFGAPYLSDAQKQPWIVILGRDSVENLKNEAAALGGQPELIKGDAESYEIDGSGDIDFCEGKNALYVYLYEKKDGRVFVSKATREAVICPETDTGLSLYPIAWGNWEKQKNKYHGRALVTGIIPNQIYINTMFAMVMRHLQLMGFPKTVYNGDIIPMWNSEVGQAIAVKNLQPGQDIRNVAANLTPADMSNQIIATIDKAMIYTRECLGATDAQLGNVKPDNTSALMVLQSSAEVPLENTRAGLYEWLEDIGAILLDMMGTFYGVRTIISDREVQEIATDEFGGPIIDEESGKLKTETVTRRMPMSYDFSRFKNLWLSIRADVGASTYYSEIAMIQTLDNLRREGILSITDYLERLPDRLIPQKAQLLQHFRKASDAENEQLPESKTGGPLVGGALSADKALSTLPTRIQSIYEKLPEQARKALVQRQNLK